MGLDEAAVYIASALPCHMPLADLPALAASGMDTVTAHHVALAAPQRLLVLGTALVPMLAGAAPDGLREINHGERKVPVMVSETLEAMMGSPKLKARFWRRWMEWSASL
jgi:DNA polymerase